MSYEESRNSIDKTSTENGVLLINYFVKQIGIVAKSIIGVTVISHVFNKIKITVYVEIFNLTCKHCG